MNTPNSYRYIVKDNQFVAMNHAQEYEWVYQSLATEVLARMGEDVAKYLVTMVGNRLYVPQVDTTNPVETIPIELEELGEIARGFGVLPEDIELKEYFFHLIDSNGIQHGFDLRDFECRDQLLINSFACIIGKYFNFDQAIIPIKLPTYLASSLCDAFILVFLHEYKPAIGELIDFGHPDYVRVNQQTTWLTQTPL